MKLTELLDQIDRLDQQATKGPWEIDEHDTNPNMDSIVSTALGDLRWIEVARSINHDTEFIALARTALPKLAEAVQAILDLHRPLADESCDTCEGAWLYPCPTVQAITDAMGAAGVV